jgi:hypothetical protein
VHVARAGRHRLGQQLVEEGLVFVRARDHAGAARTSVSPSR